MFRRLMNTNICIHWNSFAPFQQKHCTFKTLVEENYYFYFFIVSLNMSLLFEGTLFPLVDNLLWLALC